MDVHVHSSCVDCIVLLEDIEFDKEAAARNITQSLKDVIITEFGVSCTVSKPGSSTEIHKEVEDKRVVREVMCILQSECPVMYSDEVCFNIGSRAKGPHGIIDLIVGKKTHQDLEKCVIVKHYNADHKVHIFEPQLAGMKPVKETLVKHQLINLLSETNHVPYVTDIEAIAQPVAQLLTVGYRFSSLKRHILFFVNREFVRPFVYYPTVDLMLTTGMSYQWLNMTERKLEQTGAVLMAVLCQSSEVIQLREDVGHLLSVGNFTTTGFVTAITNAKQGEAFLAAELCSQIIPDTTPSRQNPVSVLPLRNHTAEVLDQLRAKKSQEKKN